MSVQKTRLCPCGSKKNYLQCCGQYIDHDVDAATAEILMRSRYTAYATQNAEYLACTWHKSTRPVSLDLGGNATEWLKLKILKTKAGKPHNIEGTVEFKAYFKVHDQRQQLHEVSRFVKEANCWYYLDGDVKET